MDEYRDEIIDGIKEVTAGSAEEETGEGSIGLPEGEVIISAEDMTAEALPVMAEHTPAPKHKHKRKRRRTAFKFVLTFAAGFATCLAVFALVIFGLDKGRVIPTADYDYYNKLSDEYGKYYIIREMIGEDPLVDKVPEAVSDEYLKELVSELGDPYAAYYTAEEYAEFLRTYSGDYVGIGILVADTDDGLVVQQVYDGGPAADAGMQAGDIILRVDGVKPTDISDAVSRMTGEANTEVTVTVSRDGKEMDLKMTRAPIELDSVAYTALEKYPDIGYIAITLFSKDTDKEFERAVKELKDKGCDKFIIDLRDNGGGITDSSIGIADYLLPECKIMTDVTKDGKETVYNSKASSADLDMVVLVNENTASASEILTAAIKDNHAGKIIGTKTYGKGVTQISRQFKDGSAIKLTYSEYLTPNGDHVNKNGIEPDIEVPGEEALDKAFEVLEQ